MDIYLSPKNNTEEKIRRKVKQHKVHKVSYIIFYIITAIFNEIATSTVRPDLMNSTKVDVIYLTVSIVAFIIQIASECSSA